MLPIYWRESALEELAAIATFIALRNEAAAISLTEQIELAVSAAAAHPYLYRAGRVSGTRELVAHPNYIVVYRVTDRVEVLNVLHARQRYPR
ncbi:type II toxin-antitoxin system RelE/ParE family toxin [Thiomonas sp. 13-64-67]|jgi:addiction module RelE/StbE family toxin|uniref:type II toxin-antitoxin system RelE/ParE family toxin n=1 Tax=Thiomonas sp. 13-64-67 TaxID=1970447 RepID=UPI000BDB94E4|nr:type II toxin-antitoxin system RelE/ParE family toxin [Thiomonas sp. 13-64-67]OZB68722.1 MAG: addiction module antitoxin [Thiomonas sp. 13-64-67]